MENSSRAATQGHPPAHLLTPNTAAYPGPRVTCHITSPAGECMSGFCFPLVTSIRESVHPALSLLQCEYSQPILPGDSHCSHRWLQPSSQPQPCQSTAHASVYPCANTAMGVKLGTENNGNSSTPNNHPNCSTHQKGTDLHPPAPYHIPTTLQV